VRATRWLASVGFGLAALTAKADATPPQDGAPDPLDKLTLAVYRADGDTSYDVNVRRKFGEFVAWLGGFYDPMGPSQARVGAEYDFGRERALAVPSLQLASNGFIQGSVYSELGGTTHAIVGYSRTNLRPYATLTFDPNDSAQLGIGRIFRDAGRIDLFTIADIRLGTGQQNTHLIWRRLFPRGDRVTLDILYKSGHADSGDFVRGAGATLTFDWPRWFLRWAYDPYANFSAYTMVRIGGGFRF
jgi:hypothetical protein